MGILYGLILIGRGKSAPKILISFVVIELLLNSIVTLSRLGYVMNSEFTAYQSSLADWSTVLRPAENEFYRSEKKRYFDRKMIAYKFQRTAYLIFHPPLKKKEKSSLTRLVFAKEPPTSTTATAPY